MSDGANGRTRDRRPSPGTRWPPSWRPPARRRRAAGTPTRRPGTPSPRSSPPGWPSGRSRRRRSRRPCRPRTPERAAAGPDAGRRPGGGAGAGGGAGRGAAASCSTRRSCAAASRRCCSSWTTRSTRRPWPRRCAARSSRCAPGWPSWPTDYDQRRSGLTLRQVGEGWRLYTREEHAAVVERYLVDGQRSRLTQAALETLAVIAYRQPVTRARVSAIRGVGVDGVMRTLLDPRAGARGGHRPRQRRRALRDDAAVPGAARADRPGRAARSWRRCCPRRRPMLDEHPDS